MELVEKLKTYFNEVADKLAANSSELSKVVRENKQMLDAYRKLIKESKEGISSYKNYGEKETPGLQDALTSICDALTKVDEELNEMVLESEHQFITPLDELLSEWVKQNNEIKEHKKAQSTHEKLKKKLEKVQAKPPEKQKPGEADQAAAQLKAATETLSKEHEDVIVATAEFNKKKVETLNETLKNMLTIRMEFHQKAINILKEAEAKVKAIDVEKENDVVIATPEE